MNVMLVFIYKMEIANIVFITASIVTVSKIVRNAKCNTSSKIINARNVLKTVSNVWIMRLALWKQQTDISSNYFYLLPWHSRCWQEKQQNSSIFIKRPELEFVLCCLFVEINLSCCKDWFNIISDYVQLRLMGKKSIFSTKKRKENNITQLLCETIFKKVLKKTKQEFACDKQAPQQFENSLTIC